MKLNVFVVAGCVDVRLQAPHFLVYMKIVKCNKLRDVLRNLSLSFSSHKLILLKDFLEGFFENFKSKFIVVLFIYFATLFETFEYCFKFDMMDSSNNLIYS